MGEPEHQIAGGEGQHLDHKSLRTVTGRTADFAELAKDCVCFANGSGGRLLIGVEDDATEPPSDQRVPASLLDRIRKRIGELAVNVDLAAEVHTSRNGGEYIVLTIPRAVGVASTSDGRYFLRVGDDCRPVVGDDVLRLVTERPSVPWETMTSLAVPRGRCDAGKRASLCAALRASDRVKDSVREKTDAEILDHYGLASGDLLTNLGVLLIGATADRARLGTAPVVQAVKYDERGVKVAKHVWDDYSLSPVDLVDAVWQGVPDFRETYELPDGLFRSRVPAYEEAVARELVVNALVHRPYTQRGDVFLNLHPDRLEVANAGRLPLGVTPQNILHASRRRNDGLARIFHDLKLMEREGSGFDLMYDRLLTSGRARGHSAAGGAPRCHPPHRRRGSTRPSDPARAHRSRHVGPVRGDVGRRAGRRPRAARARGAAALDRPPRRAGVRGADGSNAGNPLLRGAGPPARCGT
jgi:ATP-dependent DNA helicase RecG